MIVITDAGIKIFTRKVIEEIKTIHLYTAHGEMSGHNYSPEAIFPNDWKDGVHPDITWTFTAGEPVQVLGWYFTNSKGEVLITETFNILNEGDYEVRRDGDKITVKPSISLISLMAG